MSSSCSTPLFEFAAVILGAGASARMGRPKLLLSWNQTSVIGHLLDQWRELGARQMVVVCAAGDPNLERELDRLGFPVENRIVNPTPRLGMFSSIQCAARWRGWHQSLTHWIIALGDQPHLRIETLRGLIEFAIQRPATICQPSRQGFRRHPVVLPRAVFEQLQDCPEENLKVFLSNRSSDSAGCEVDDPGLDLDLDRPDDYEKALRIWAARPNAQTATADRSQPHPQS